MIAAVPLMLLFLLFLLFNNRAIARAART